MTCKSGYDEGVLRAYVDRELPARQQEEIGRHLAECATCSEALTEIEANREAVSASLRKLEPDARRVPSAGVAFARFSAGQTRAAPAMGLLGRLGSWLATAPRALPAATVAAIALIAALAFTPLGLAAQDFFFVFRAQNIQTIKLSPDTLKQIPNANDLGTLTTSGDPEVAVVTSAEAARQVGFAVRAPKTLPSDFSTKGVVTYWKPMDATYAYDAAKVATYWKQKGLAGDPPAELGGLVVKVLMPATVAKRTPPGFNR